MKTPDVYIKHEGYADIKFLTNKAKETAHKLGIANSLTSFGKTFCGQPVWNPTTKKGLYTIGVKVSALKRICKELKKNGLVIESEFDLNNI